MLVMGLGVGCHTNNSKFEDLTTDSIAITKLIILCNKLKLAPIHLEAVVEDFLVDTL